MTIFAMRLKHLSGTGSTPGSVFSRAVGILHEQAAGKFALGFPEARNGARDADGARKEPSLGKEMVVYAQDKDCLIDLKSALDDLADYLHFGRAIEAHGGVFVCHRRVQNLYRGTPAAIERRLRRTMTLAAAREKPLTEAEIASRRRAAEKPQPESELPYLNIRSRSTGQRFALSFSTEPATERGSWSFDSYGFAKPGAAVPAL